MAIEEVIGGSTDIVKDAALAVGTIMLWLKAIGVLIVIWIIAHIVNIFLNRKNSKTINSIKEDLERIEEKIDKLSKK